MSAVWVLFELHPDAGSFSIAPGAHATQPLNVMGEVDGLVTSRLGASCTASPMCARSPSRCPRSQRNAVRDGVEYAANHELARTTSLYNRRTDRINLDEIERIATQKVGNQSSPSMKPTRPSTADNLIFLTAYSYSMDDALPDTLATGELRYTLVVREVEARLGREVAATYMRTKNFALGGRTPYELVATEEGTRQVLAEISAHAGGGPF